MDSMIAALNASPTALERPVCRGWTGDWQITGKHGYILEDGSGYLLFVTTGESVRRWNNVKKRLDFAPLTQDGDDEGILRLDRLPTSAEAEAIRDVIGIRKRRHMTAEALANLERARLAIKSPVPVRLRKQARTYFWQVMCMSFPDL